MKYVQQQRFRIVLLPLPLYTTVDGKHDNLMFDMTSGI